MLSNYFGGKGVPHRRRRVWNSTIADQLEVYHLYGVGSTCNRLEEEYCLLSDIFPCSEGFHRCPHPESFEETSLIQK